MDIIIELLIFGSYCAQAIIYVQNLNNLVDTPINMINI